MTNLAKRRLTFLAKRQAKRDLDAARFSTVAKATFHKPTFIEAEDGQRIRVWSDCSRDASGRVIPSLDTVKDEDVRSWLLGLRATDLREALEFVHEKYARGMIRDGYLRADPVVAGRLWVTDKAAQRWNLPKVLGCAFVPAEGEMVARQRAA